MTQKITIIGGLPQDTDRDLLLEELRNLTTTEDIEWEWLKANPPNYNVPEKQIRRLLGIFRTPRPGILNPIVVKLDLLNGREANRVYKSGIEPILAPTSLNNADDLIEWIFSSETCLIPNTKWFGNIVEAALAAVLSKLIKNKSWNKDSQGHAWTKEYNLLGQNPVNRPGFEDILAEAQVLLRMGTKTLFLTKGSSQGKTPKEWCINIKHAPLAKSMIAAQSFASLEAEASLNALHRRILGSGEACCRIDGEIVTERVKQICLH